MRYVLIFSVLVLAGCTSTIHMRHPDGRLAECGGTYAVGYHNFAARQGDRDCVADYQRQGYERAPR